MEDEETPLDRLEAASREVEALASEVALDELAGYPYSPEDITDE